MNETLRNPALVYVLLYRERAFTGVPCMLDAVEYKTLFQPENHKIFEAEGQQELDALLAGVADEDRYNLLLEKCWKNQLAIVDFELKYDWDSPEV
jgi:hypothetical protein